MFNQEFLAAYRAMTPSERAWNMLYIEWMEARDILLAQLNQATKDLLPGEWQKQEVIQIVGQGKPAQCLLSANLQFPIEQLDDS